MSHPESDDQPVAKRSIHRAPAISLPADAGQAAALVLRYVQAGDTSFDRSAALEGMAARISGLASLDGEQVERELFAHAAVLDACFLRWTAEAVSAKVPDYALKFSKAALQAQAAYTRTMVAIAGLRLQRQGQGSIQHHEEAEDQPD